MSANDLADRLEQIADPNFPGVMGYTAAEDVCAAAALLREQAEQLDTLRNAGDPDSIRLMADNLTGIGWTPEAEVMHAIAGVLDALAAAGGGATEEGATDE